MKKTIKQLFLNPIFIIFNFLFWYEFARFCMLGNVKKRLPIIIILLIIIIINSLIIIIKKRNISISFKKIVIEILLITMPIMYFSYQIYYSAIPFNGKLSWYLNDLQNKRSITFKHNNLFDTGINGILEDLNELAFDDVLYVSSNFSIEFSNDGTITKIDTLLYDKNQSYLITYDSNKSDKIDVVLHGYVNKKYLDSKLLKPFINIFDNFNIKNELTNDTVYNIVYYGIKDYGYNTQDKYYLYDNGNIVPVNDNLLLNNYAMKLSSKNFERIYLLIGDSIIDSSNNAQNITDKENIKEVTIGKTYVDDDNNVVYMINSKLGYRLIILDAAAGSRFYGLEKTTDGKTWTQINGNPFSDEIGVASNIIFSDENNGIIELSNASSELKGTYRTSDGGITFIKE